MRLVVDACVFVAEQIEGLTEHKEAAAFLELCVRDGHRLYAPAIAIAEVSGAVARMTGSGVLGGVAASRLSHFSRLTYRQVDIAFAEAAARIAARYCLRGADAHYAALARELRCPLITNDDELIKRCPSTMEVWTPAECLARYHRK